MQVKAATDAEFQSVQNRFKRRSASMNALADMEVGQVIYRPTKLKRYQFTVKVSDYPTLLNGGRDDIQASTLISRLDGYLDDTWPSTLKEAEDGATSATSHTVFVREVRREQVITDDISGQRVFLYTVVASEVDVS